MVVRQTKYDEELGGFAVPAGTNLLMSIWAMCRDPTAFADDPNAFRPERWLDKARRAMA